MDTSRASPLGRWDWGPSSPCTSGIPRPHLPSALPRPFDPCAWSGQGPQSARLGGHHVAFTLPLPKGMGATCRRIQKRLRTRCCLPRRCRSHLAATSVALFPRFRAGSGASSQRRPLVLTTARSRLPGDRALFAESREVSESPSPSLSGVRSADLVVAVVLAGDPSCEPGGESMAGLAVADISAGPPGSPLVDPPPTPIAERPLQVFIGGAVRSKVLFFVEVRCAGGG
jgi:hypothetical protein